MCSISYARVQEGPSVKILFVCTGNICRSPLAEVMARRLSPGRGITFVSAGTYAIAGDPASRTGAAAAARIGLDLSGHRARPLTSSLVADAEHIFGMEQEHVDAVRALDASAPVELLLPDGSGVPDPYGADVPVYLHIYDMIRRGLEARLADLGRSRKGGL